MPAFVKTPKDEARWSKAKAAASKSKGKNEDSFTDQDWALTNHIYHNMNKEEAADGITKLLVKAKDRIEDEDSKPSGKDVKLSDMDPERLKALKDVSGHWLNYMDQARKQKADARINPHLHAEGHRQAAHNAAHEDFNTAYHNFTQSKEYQDLSPAKRMRAEIKFKKEFQEKNPDYHKNASEAVSVAHGMHDKAKELHEKEMNARKAHIMSGGQSNAQTFSDQEAAQHVGAGKDDEGAYSSTTIKDPAAAFAAQYKQHLAGEQKPQVKESDEYEEMENPEMKVHKHPKLDEPGNKKLINDFFQEYYPLIQKTAHKARNSAIANGVPEDKIDMSALHEAGMHGLMQAANDYHPDVGASFATHAKGKMGGLMQSHLGSQDYVPRDMRAKMKAKDKNILAPSAAPVTEEPAAPAASAKSSVHDVIANSGHPAAADMADRLKRADTQRTVIRRPGK